MLPFLLNQCVDLDALDDAIQVHPPGQAVHIDRVQHPFDVRLLRHTVHVNPVQQRIHVQRGNHDLERTLSDGLGQRLRAREQSPLYRLRSLKPIPRGKYRCVMRAKATPVPRAARPDRNAGAWPEP